MKKFIVISLLMLFGLLGYSQTKTLEGNIMIKGQFLKLTNRVDTLLMDIHSPDSLIMSFTGKGYFVMDTIIMANPVKLNNVYCEIPGATVYFWDGLFSYDNVICNSGFFTDYINTQNNDSIQVIDDMVIDSTLRVRDSILVDIIYPDDSTEVWIDELYVDGDLEVWDNAQIDGTLSVDLINPEGSTYTEFGADVLMDYDLKVNDDIVNASDTVLGEMYWAVWEVDTLRKQLLELSIYSGDVGSDIGCVDLYVDTVRTCDTIVTIGTTKFEDNVHVIDNLILENVSLETSLDYSLGLQGDTVVKLEYIPLDSITGNIANSGTSLDTVFSDVFIGTIGSSTSCNDVYADTIYGCSPIVLSTDNVEVTDTLKLHTNQYIVGSNSNLLIGKDFGIGAAETFINLQGDFMGNGQLNLNAYKSGFQLSESYSYWNTYKGVGNSIVSTIYLYPDSTIISNTTPDDYAILRLDSTKAELTSDTRINLVSPLITSNGRLEVEKIGNNINATDSIYATSINYTSAINMNNGGVIGNPYSSLMFNHTVSAPRIMMEVSGGTYYVDYVQDTLKSQIVSYGINNTSTFTIDTSQMHYETVDGSGYGGTFNITNATSTQEINGIEGVYNSGIYMDTLSVSLGSVYTSGSNYIIVDTTKIELRGCVTNPTGTIADNDATPDVTGRNVWTYNGTANSVTITNLDNAVVDAIYTIIGNSDTYTITINDSGNFHLSNNITLGQYDNLIVRCVAANTFIQVGRNDN